MSEPITTQLGQFAATGTGTPRVGQAGDHTFGATVTGPAAVAAIVLIEGSNDNVGWTTLATLTLSGTASASASTASTSSYAYWRATVSALTGTGVVVAAATEQATDAAQLTSLQKSRLMAILPATEALVSGGWKARNRCVIYGDSITNYNQATTSGALANQSRGPVVWANALLGRRRLEIVSNAGGGGDTTAMMLARIADVLAVDAEWVIVLGGVNDIVGQGYQLSTVTANLQTIYERLRAAGRRVIALSTLPVTAAHAAYTLQKNQRIARLNTWIKSYCAANTGMVYVDAFGAVTDPAAATLAPLAGYYADTTHPGTPAAYAIGKALAAAIQPLLTPYDDGPSTLGDTYLSQRQTVTSLTGDGVTATATLAGHNYLVGDPITTEGATPAGYNGSWVITAVTTNTFSWACSAASGAATGTIYVSGSDQLLDNPLFGTPTSGLASSWTRSPVDNSGNPTITTTTVARADGLGNWQQLAVAASASGAAYIQGGDYITRAFAGDTLVWEVECEVDAGAVNLEGVQLQLNTIVGGSAYTPIAFNRLVGSLMPSAAWSGLLRTEPFTLPAGAVTRIRPQAYAYFSGAGSATVRFGRASLRKVR